MYLLVCSKEDGVMIIAGEEMRDPEIALKIQCHQERLKVVLAELVALET